MRANLTGAALLALVLLPSCGPSAKDQRCKELSDQIGFAIAAPAQRRAASGSTWEYGPTIDARQERIDAAQQTYNAECGPGKR